MKKIIIIGASVAAQALAEHFCRRHPKTEIVVVAPEAKKTAISIPMAKMPVIEQTIPSYRKGKGQKKRAASARHRKGWR